MDAWLSRDDLTLREIETQKAEHLQQIAFFSHERLVHLIVTMTVAILLLIAFATLIVSEYVPFAVVVILLLGLFVPYIVHYMHLENGVQAMYGQYDRIVEKERQARAGAGADQGDEKAGE